MLPYTAEVLFSLMGRYNAAMGPGVTLAPALALAALALALRPQPGGSRAIAALLAAGWLWSGAVFHWQYFAPLNFAAPVYAAGFALQAALLMVTGLALGRLRLRFARDAQGIVGGVLMLLALLGNPVLGWLAGWPVAQTPVVGLAPDPTAMFTLGMLLLARPVVPLHLLALPVGWALWSGWMSWTLGVASDLALPAGAILALALAFGVRIRARSPAP